MPCGGRPGAARTTGEYVTAQLRELQGRHRLIGDARCPGLIAAIELVRDRKTKEPAATETEQVYMLALRQGVMFGTHRYAGLGNAIRFKPPLTISREEVDEAIDVLDSVLGAVAGPWIAAYASVQQPHGPASCRDLCTVHRSELTRRSPDR